MNEMSLLNSLTMSSREIAELCGKRHDNVMRDIRLMLIDLHGVDGVLKFEDTQINQQNDQRYPIFRLPKRETLILVSGYSVVMRARIIDRWQELEARAAQPAVNLDDPAFLRGALLQYTERVIALEQKVAEQAPAVEFAHAIRDTSDAISIAHMSAVLGIGRNRFFARLRADHILMADNLPYQIYKDRGYFRVIESVWIDEAKEPHPTFKTLVTGRGQVFLQRKYGAEAA
ncbi:phage regulatory protein/antirepressor Ant [Caballeronia sp. LZ028]|uniref:Rha family transcriptional regulator n=1 Tax=Caballeronia sp. LZ028 TaxID=3038563 RepID=UPI002856C719|nr:phage regulatory protein/antirepressor Ant [Caballeronia sp. LZ028]MDR5765016.1 phage regulatory protein/antirepressor Ant [Caballeronia sp. LZ028]